MVPFFIELEQPLTHISRSCHYLTLNIGNIVVIVVVSDVDVFTSAALCQWLFFALFYERFVEHPIQQFVDLCSTCNISMLLLESDIYGYYIHGQSVHGKADTGLRQMHENMVQEEVCTAG